MTHPRPSRTTDPFAVAILDWASFLRRHFLALLIVFVVSAAGSMAYTLRLPNRYTTTASILPHLSPPPIPGTTELLGEAALGAAPAAMAGLYAEVARSRGILTELLDLEHQGGSVRATLTREFGPGYLSDPELVDHLGEIFRVEVDHRTHVVRASATHRDPNFAVALLAGLLERIDFHIQNRTARGFGYTRDILEMRREQTAEVLRLAQERLQTFERENPARELSGSLLTRRDALRAEIASAERLYRSVSDQCDLARVAEQHYASSVSVLDRPAVPGRKSGPPRARIVVISIAIALFAAVLYMRANDAVRRHLAALATEG